MIIFITLICVFIICLGMYIHGYKQGFIDGKLEAKWRAKDER